MTSLRLRVPKGVGSNARLPYAESTYLTFGERLGTCLCESTLELAAETIFA